MACLKQVEAGARALLQAEGFGHVPFEFERTTKRFGSVIIDTFTGDAVVMTMSRGYAAVNTYERCMDNVRHEVAHLLTWWEEGDHGPAWKATAIGLGLGLPLAYVSPHDTALPWFWQSYFTKDRTKSLVTP